ncbi:mevalonate kinase [Aerococcaceae bacterium DSM 111020]|nr:mevalonate kinase [Aerococcaceae bacterium DSM 111020]
MSYSTHDTLHQQTPSIGHGQAHSKIILMGEHAVVYGVPAIALPFTAASTKVIVQKNNHSVSYFESEYFTGTAAEMPDEMNNLKQVIQLTLDSFALPKEPLHYKVTSNIPVKRGMGSSAAVSVALVRAITDYYQVHLSDYQLKMIVNQAEIIAHETTSGIDTLMASSHRPVMYQKSEPPVPFDINLKAFLIVADSGIEGQTKIAVGKVRQLYEQRPSMVKDALKSIERFVKLGYQAIKQQDTNELGRLLTYNHYYLNQLGISDPKLDHIIRAAWYAGALGAKLTGGGLGGCAIALAETQTIAQTIADAMKQAGAQNTWILNLAMNEEEN